MDQQTAATPSDSTVTDPADERVIGALRIFLPSDWLDIGRQMEEQVEAALIARNAQVSSYVKIDPRTYLLYLANPIEDDAQFDANLLSEEIRAELAGALKMGSDLRVKTIVLTIPLTTLAAAVGFPERLVAVIDHHWRKKKEREKSEAAQLRSAETQSKAGAPRPDTITYVSSDIDNALSRMSSSDIDRLPFGVIKITRTGTILQFNQREAELTELAPKNIIGRNFFRDIAPCTNRREFLGRFVEGVKSGKLDITFNYLFDFRMKPRRVKVHLKKSYHDDHYWILVEMTDPARAKSAPQ